MTLLLHEPLPLRTTGDLGNFAEEKVLPHRFGDLTSGRFGLIRLDNSNFFAADHVMEITQGFIDAQKTATWERQIKSNATGKTWTQVRFASPIPAESTASATGIGNRDPRTNAVIDNPADIIEYFLRLAGRSDRWWDQLRAEAAEAGLRLAGSVESAMSIAETIDQVAMSCGAIWCPGMARLYPVSTVSGYAGVLNKVSNLVVSANLNNTADVLRLYYDPDKASGKNQHYIKLTANPQRYSGLPTSLAFDWLRTPSNAESVGRRVLPWLAGERYDVSFDCGDPAVRPGQWGKLIAHPEWPFPEVDPVVMILKAGIKPKPGSIACQGIALVSAPAAVVTAHSVALPTTREAGVEVSNQGGVTTLFLFDEKEQPLFDALVSLDGGAPKKTNSRGEVSFAVKIVPGKPKQHRLASQAPGRQATVQFIWL